MLCESFKNFGITLGDILQNITVLDESGRTRTDPDRTGQTRTDSDRPVETRIVPDRPEQTRKNPESRTNPTDLDSPRQTQIVPDIARLTDRPRQTQTDPDIPRHTGQTYTRTDSSGPKWTSRPIFSLVTCRRG